MKKLFVLGAFVSIAGISSSHALDCDRLIQRFQDEGISNAQELMPSQLTRLNSCIEDSNGDATTSTLISFYPKAMENPDFNLGQNSKYYDTSKYEIKHFSKIDIQDRSNYYDVIAIEKNYERFEEAGEIPGKPGQYIVTYPNQLCAHLMPKSVSINSTVNSTQVHNTSSKPAGISIIEKKKFLSSEIVIEAFKEDRNVFLYENITCVKPISSQYKIVHGEIAQIISFTVEVQVPRNDNDARINDSSNRNDEVDSVRSSTGSYWSNDWRVETVNR